MLVRKFLRKVGYFEDHDQSSGIWPEISWPQGRASKTLINAIGRIQRINRRLMLHQSLVFDRMASVGHGHCQLSEEETQWNSDQVH